MPVVTFDLVRPPLTGRCAVCGEPYQSGAFGLVAHLDGRELGEVCPVCRLNLEAASDPVE